MDRVQEQNLLRFYVHQFFYHFSHIMVDLVRPLFLYLYFDSISAVFIWALIWNVVFLVGFVPSFNLAMRCKRPRLVMAFGVLCNALSLLLFGLSESGGFTCIVVGTIFFQLHMLSYWMVRHWFLSVNTSTKLIGRQVSILGILQVLVAALAPLVGGMLSVVYSFNVTFLLGALAVVLGIIPILFFDDSKRRVQISKALVRTVLKDPLYTTIRFAYVCEGIIESFFRTSWVLAFAIFIGNVGSLGLMISISTLVSALIIRNVGVSFDRDRRKEVLRYTCIARAIAGFSYVTACISPSLLIISLIDIMNRISNYAHEVVTQSYIYGYSNSHHPVAFHVNRQIFTSFGRIGSNILMIVIFQFAPATALWGFIAIGALCFLGWTRLDRSDYVLKAA